MKIFLLDRTVRFLPCPESDTLPSDRVVEFQSVEKLKTAWKEFERYEKYKTLTIVDPHFTDHDTSPALEAFISLFKMIPAAGGLVKNEKGEFLFIHRLGVWDLPKGKIDKKDLPGSGYSAFDSLTARAAAIREVKEETGLKIVHIVRDLPFTWHIYPSKERWIIKRTQWFEMLADSDQELKPQTGEGIFLVKWTAPARIHCVLSHTYSSLRELLLEVLF